MIQLGKSQVFEWQVPQAINRFIGRKLAPANLFEELTDGIGVQRSTQPSAVSS